MTTTSDMCTHVLVWTLSDDYNRDGLQDCFDAHGIHTVEDMAEYIATTMGVTVKVVTSSGGIAMRGTPAQLRAVSVLTAAVEGPAAIWAALNGVVEGIYPDDQATPEQDAAFAAFVFAAVELCRTAIRAQDPAALNARLHALDQERGA